MFGRFALWLEGKADRARTAKYRNRYVIHAHAAIGKVHITGKNVTVGKGTYFNSGYISSGETAKVNIGVWTAIGYNVSLVAATHDVNFPTGPEHIRPMHSGDVSIGDGVWIGNNVVVLPGVSIGNFAVIGANSVVNSDVPDFAVCAGMPARVIKTKDREACKKHVQFVESNK
jgi:acetyltransferase-like isoleucine patch superfamily enzyme